MSIPPKPTLPTLANLKAAQPNLPIPAEIKHPARHRIEGDTHLIDELKKIVAATDVDEPLKAFIAAELDKMETNAATVHLHVVDLPDGGMAVNMHIVPVVLGSRSKKPSA